MRSRARNRQSGFTLGELMTTVVVATVLAAIALPSYQSIMRTARLTTQIYDFAASLNLARSEAVKRGVPITVCPSTDQATCAPSSTNWESGWIVFVDANNNQTVDTGEAILRATTALVSGYTLRGISSTSLASHVTVNPKGQVTITDNLSGNAVASGQFILCASGQLNPSRGVLVNNVGRISIATDDNGTPLDASGADMTSCTP